MCQVFWCVQSCYDAGVGGDAEKHKNTLVPFMNSVLTGMALANDVPVPKVACLLTYH